MRLAPGAVRVVTLVSLLVGGAPWARATVPGEDAELPAPAVVVMQPSDSLASGPLSRGVAGDYRLEYGTVAFVVAQPDSVAQGGAGRRAPEAGGAVIDVVQLFPSQRHLGLSRIATQLGGAPGRQAVYTRAGVSRETDLGTVRVEGYDSADPAVGITTEYQVGPRLRIGDGMRIVTTVRNQGQRPVRPYALGDDIRWGELDRFAPGGGFLTPGPRTLLPFLEGLGPVGGLVYLPSAPPGVLGTHDPRSSQVAQGGAADIEPGTSVSYVRTLLVSTDPARGLCSGRSPIAGSSKLTGTVKEDGTGARLRARVVLLRDGGDALIAGTTDVEGRFFLCAPGPGDYRLLAEAPGRAQLRGPKDPRSGVALHLGAAAPDVSLTLSKPSRLSITLRDAATRHGGRPGPGRVTVLALDDRGSARRGIALLPGSAAAVYGRPDGVDAVTGSGEIDLAVPPGRYRVVASHGLLYDLTSQEVAVRPGETRKIALSLRRAVPSSEVQGTRCAVLRASPSTEESAAAARAEGLDVLLSGDGPAQRGLGTGLYSVPAVEARSPGRDRYQLYPVPPATVVPDPRRAPSAVALFGALRGVTIDGQAPDRVGDLPILQVRPVAGVPLGTGYDAWEVWTGSDTVAALHDLRAYLTYIDREAPQAPRSIAREAPQAPRSIAREAPQAPRSMAREAPQAPRSIAPAQGVPAAVGGADPRDESLLTAPRTCYGEIQTVRALSPGMELAAAVRRGDLFVTNGPILRVTANGAAQGEIAAAPDGRVLLGITALAAPWVDLRELLVYVGSKQAARIPVPASTAPLRYQGTVPVSIDRDAAIVVVATGERPLFPLLPGARPLAFTSPLLVDRDGDGRYGAAPPRMPPAQGHKR